MQIFSSFEHSSYIELAITALEQIGIEKENILAVPLYNRIEERKLFDTLHRADGVSLFDTGAALGTAFSVIGTCFGFALAWGPIIWGLIGAIIGFLLGFIINYTFYKITRNKQRALKGKKSEVFLVINCPQEIVEQVEKILWENFALGVSKV
ncbi:hypothetical protein [Salipaludibacillus daqingensis]|uniref:hypothetical protein n=1 Tax=Salipaludibacillus daqingensis TaxID=3041001 RepID=UPI002473C796|nr:hypothetical protein [Salipaludibacillus daqingensis]